MKSHLIALAVLTLASACGPQGSAEKSGESMDSAIEKATQGGVDRSDGPLENAGEAIDKVTGQRNNDPVDAIQDATDNDPKTRP
jgi:hypothetical protein